ncbi:MAG: phosphatase PAP2 family protein [Calditrichaceae bacterium]
MTSKKEFSGSLVVFLIISLIIIHPKVYSQESNYTIPQNENLLSGLWNDVKYVGHETFSPEHNQSWKVLTYAGFAAMLYFGSDTEVREEYATEKDYQPAGVPKYFGEIGNIYDQPGTYYFTAGLLGTFYGSGKIFNNTKLQETTVLMIRSLLITGLATSVLKVAIGRERPYVDGDPNEYRPFSFNPDYMSMPSGHSSSIFAMMTVIAKQYDEWYIKVPAYAFAASVTAQRINTDKHWSSDVLIGSTIGYLIGSAIVKRYQYKGRYIDVQPTVSSRGLGLNVKF